MEKEIEQLIKSNKANSVVLYRLPFANEMHMIVGDGEELIFGVNEHIIAKKGFVYEPFDNVNTKGVFINELFHYTFTRISEKFKQVLAPMFAVTRKNTHVNSDYTAYSKQFKVLHQAIADKHIDKVILSRTMLGPALNDTKTVELFDTLSNKYPHAFVYAINSPTTGVWLGAGPELLLKNDGKTMETVSLAGTLPNTDNAKWSDKELIEQHLVTEYVESVLLKHDAGDIKIIGPETIQAAQVKHLRTSFSFESAFINGNQLGLLYELHPTPAVCGMPKEDAHHLILDTEQHNRKYYSGFLGPVNERRYEFYVNIRCLEVFKDSTVLFIGGLTKDSEVKKEWDETELKAETLLSVLKNI